MLLQVTSRFTRFKTVGGPLDNQVAENHGIQEAFDVRDGVFSKWGVKFISKPAAVDGKDLNEIDIVTRINRLDFNMEERVGDRFASHSFNTRIKTKARHEAGRFRIRDGVLKTEACHFFFRLFAVAFLDGGKDAGNCNKPADDEEIFHLPDSFLNPIRC